MARRRSGVRRRPSWPRPSPPCRWRSGSRVADGRPVAVSERWFELTGQTDAVSHEAGWNAVIHPDERQRVTQGWSRFVASGERAFDEQYRIVHAGSGQVRVLADRFVRVECDGGPVFVGVTDDVTERFEASDKARRLGAKHDALQRVAEFVAARPDIAAVAQVVSEEVAQLFGTRRAPSSGSRKTGRDWSPASGRSRRFRASTSARGSTCRDRTPRRWCTRPEPRFACGRETGPTCCCRASSSGSPSRCMSAAAYGARCRSTRRPRTAST